MGPYITSLKEMIALGLLGVAGNISPFILPVIVGALSGLCRFFHTGGELYRLCRYVRPWSRHPVVVLLYYQS